MYFVYVLLSEKDSKFYTGYTSNLRNRIDKHFKGKVIATKNRRPIRLIYYEAYINKADAKGREKFLKGGSGHKYLYKQLANYLNEFD